jgi:beta-glucanase (GH16 family)
MQHRKKNYFSITIDRLAKAILLLLVLIIYSCDKDDEGSRAEMTLIWSDEFNKPEGTSPNATKWAYDIGRGSNGWGNNESQYYTNRAENVSTDGQGNLKIIAKKEQYSGSNYTSARILTKGKFSQKYGRFEARIKLPRGQGIWPAFWMLGDNFTTVGWPNCGEIDLMEYLGHEVSKVHSTVHGPGYSGGSSVSSSYTLTNARFDNSFHVFAAEWSSNTIKFYVDENLYHTITPNNVKGNWVFDQPFFMILNVAIGGNWPGYPNASTYFPQTMYIDYVRVYSMN